jgi:Zn-dependent protease with chaperone function
VDARAQIAGPSLHITGSDGALLASIPLRSAQATARLGAMRRRLDFPDGGSFDTSDNDGIDQLLGLSSILHWLEASWRVVLASLLIAAIAAAAFILYGVPVTAGWLARHTPQSVARYTAGQTLATLDKIAFKPGKTALAVQQHYRALLAAVAAGAPRPAGGYRLLFRDAPGVGANAFALPDGTVIITDQMIPLVKSDDEVQGVFAHEISHVTHAHGLQRIYQASLVPAAIAFVTGDASQIGHFATILPGILLQAAYSRSFEQEADDDAARALRRIGKNPAALAGLLERMDKKMCGRAGGCAPSWLGSHPATASRAARLRRP